MNLENIITLGNAKYNKAKIPINMQLLLKRAEQFLNDPARMESHENGHSDYDKENTTHYDRHDDYPGGSGCSRHTDNTALLGHLDRYG